MTAKPHLPAPADDDPDAAYRVPAALAGLPLLMVEMAQVAGLEAAWKLFEERGGNRCYIPPKAGDDHWLVKCVGREAADKMCRHFAPSTGVELELPRGPTGLRAAVHRRLHDMIRAGCSSSEMTRTLGISRDMVKDHRRKLRLATDDPQLDLFPASPAGVTIDSTPLLAPPRKPPKGGG